MLGPITPPADLALFLGREVDATRAAFLLNDAELLCESVLTPLPAAAAIIVRRIAGRAYLNIESATQVGVGAVSTSFGAPDQVGGTGGLYLSKTDKADLLRLAGRGGAFTIDLMPADAGTNIPDYRLDG